MGKDAAGTVYSSPSFWGRMLESIPASYTIWKDGSQAMAECNVKGGTDYTTGTDPEVIQAAIDACPNGGLIFIKNGSYTISTTIDVKSDITILGENWKKIILSTTVVPMKISASQSDITLENLSFVDAGSVSNAFYLYDGADNVTFSHCYFNGFTQHVSTVVATGSETFSNIKILDCGFEDCVENDQNKAMLNLYYVSNLNIGRCRFVNNEAYMIYLHGCLYGNIDQNYFYDWAGGYDHRSAVKIANSASCPIAHDVDISDNKFVMGASTHYPHCIIISGEDHANPVERINIQGNMIHGDTGRATLGHGVYLHAGSGGDSENLRRVNVQGNQIYAGASGVVASDGHHHRIENNELYYQHNHGVWLSGTDDCIVHVNTIEDFNQAAGSYYAVYESAAPTGNVIQDNVGFVTENSGTSTGTGAQQTIAHGLALTPNRVYFSNIEDGANPYQSSAADATNIYVTAVSGKDYVWKAEVV